VRALLRSGSAIVAIDRPLEPEPGMPQILGEYLSETVAQVLSRVEVGRLFVEGGATAVSVVRRMGWSCFDVRREWATGVVSLQVRDQKGPLLSMKPGSYAWPVEILV
jgi:uncharacterized protein YgbK (DUF1537 family)